MELKPGRYSLKSLSEYFGVAYSTMRNTHKKRLKELEKVCKYHLNGKEIIIDEVFVKDFCKNHEDIYFVLNFLYNKMESKKDNSELNSVKDISKCLKEEYPKLYGVYSDRTVELRVQESVDLIFGKTYSTKENIPDEIKNKGVYKQYIWVVKDMSQPNTYRYFTEEESKTFKEIINKTLAKTEQEFIQGVGNYILNLLKEPEEMQELDFKEMSKTYKHISKESYQNDFFKIIKTFKKETNSFPVRATKFVIPIETLKYYVDNYKRTLK